VRKGRPNQEIVVCGLGDGATQQGEVLEAFAEAAREKLPVLFLVEDNAAAISTLTEGRTPYSLGGEQSSVLGLPVVRLDGRRIYGELEKLGQLMERVRAGQPAILVLRLERLCSHSSSDDEKVYRPESLRQQLAAAGDALGHFRAELIAAGAASAAELDVLDAAIATECRATAETARRVPDPAPAFDCKSPLPAAAAPGRVNEYLGTGDESSRSVTMLEAMKGVLRARLASDPRVSLCGEDIEDPKGDVFGVTRGLSTEFPGRVRNSPLSEATIVGRAVGQAMAGGKPVGFIQFGDFLSVGINQVMSEMGSLFWRSGGQFHCPAILMVTCGGYRPGLGPFHAQTLEGILAHIPGIDVMMPSNAADAAAMLNAAFDSGRPTVFLYPKALLNDRTPRQLTSSDIGSHRCAVGTARVVRAGNDLTLVAWGSTVPLAVGVAERLAKENKGVEVLDLRCLSPWDREAVLASAKKTGRVLVTHEDSLTGGFGAEVLATVAEHLPGTRVARVARADTWIPFNFPNHLDVLPSFRRLLAESARMLGLSATWPAVAASGDHAGLETLTAQGISPADDQVSVVRWLVKPGQTVRIGEHIADLETDKAIVELATPHGGQIAEILLEVDTKVPVGTPILRLRKQIAATSAASVAEVVRRPTREDWGRPVISTLPAAVVAAASTASDARPVAVYLSGIEYAEGRARLTNSMLEQRFPGRSGDDIVRLTGIRSRPMLAPDQTVVSIGVEAAEKALKAQGLSVKDLTGIVCHTTTPPFNTPSMACMILRELDPEGTCEMMVHDCNAACSGWLYALDMAWHTIRHQPSKVILVVTTEALSHVVDPADYDTAILFGDAATATIVRGTTEGQYLNGGPHLVLYRPVLSGRSDKSNALTVGFRGQGHVRMDGKRVFAEATRAMTKMTRRAFAESGLTLAQLDWLVPHQANQRIMEAVRSRLGVPREKVIDMTDIHGNTSSSSIPLSIAKSRGKFIRGQKIGVCAFGGGFTFGAAVLEVK
jgi:2-oxoisovalerate dehydrogenase E1 component